MLKQDATPRLEIAQEQSPSSSPVTPHKRPTVQSLHAAAFELYDVAIHAREVNALVLALDLDAALRIKVMTFDLVAAQTIAQAEGAR